jgi:hypothetical protein
MTKLHRPLILPDYWGHKEPIEAVDIVSFGFGLDDSILSLSTTWNGACSKDSLPELDLTELEEVKQYIEDNYVSSCFEDMETKDIEHFQRKYYRELFVAYQNAINLPVKVTDLVLKGLEEWHDFSIVAVGYSDIENPTPEWNNLFKYWGVTGFKTSFDFKEAYVKDSCLLKGGTIKANDCPCTLEYLLQFTVEGTKKETE